MTDVCVEEKRNPDEVNNLPLTSPMLCVLVALLNSVMIILL